MKNIRIIIPILACFALCFFIFGCGNVAGGGGGGGGGAPLTADRWVSTTGTDTATGSYSDPYRTIQKGLNEALSNEMIGVMTGIYTEEVIWPNKDNITLEGVSQEGTIISGEGSFRCVSIESVSNVKDATIRNMTIKDGLSQYGGGIYFKQANAYLHLYDVIISDNSYVSTGAGGGMAIGDALSTVESTRCRFINNSSYDGGGISIGSGTCILSNCEVSGNTVPSLGACGGGIYITDGTLMISSGEVSGNTASSAGGGIYASSAAANVQAVKARIINNIAQDGGGMWSMGNTTIFSSCEISGNTAEVRGGIKCSGGEMTNCLICNNKATAGYTGGLVCQTFPMELINCTITSNEAHDKYGGVEESSSGVSLTIVNCIIWGNTDSLGSPEVGAETGGVLNVTYSDVRGGYSGTGNVDIDPKFVSVSDRHLSSSTSTSVTQGGTTEGDAPDCDYDGYSRTAPYSMGAYEED